MEVQVGGSLAGKLSNEASFTSSSSGRGILPSDEPCPVGIAFNY
jgi:hypothetical protein